MHGLSFRKWNQLAATGPATSFTGNRLPFSLRRLYGDIDDDLGKAIEDGQHLHRSHRPGRDRDLGLDRLPRHRKVDSRRRHCRFVIHRLPSEQCMCRQLLQTRINGILDERPAQRLILHRISCLVGEVEFASIDRMGDNVAQCRTITSPIEMRKDNSFEIRKPN
jgi:hypothetical protein